MMRRAASIVIFLLSAVFSVVAGVAIGELDLKLRTADPFAELANLGAIGEQIDSLIVNGLPLAIVAPIALLFWSFRNPFNYARAFAISGLGGYVITAILNLLTDFGEWVFGADPIKEGELLAAILVAIFALLLIIVGLGATSLVTFAYPVRAAIRRRRRIAAGAFVLVTAVIFLLCEVAYLAVSEKVLPQDANPGPGALGPILIVEYVLLLWSALVFSRIATPRRIRLPFSSAVVERPAAAG